MLRGGTVVPGVVGTTEGITDAVGVSAAVGEAEGGREEDADEKRRVGDEDGDEDGKTIEFRVDDESVDAAAESRGVSGRALGGEVVVGDEVPADDAPKPTGAIAGLGGDLVGCGEEALSIGDAVSTGDSTVWYTVGGGVGGTLSGGGVIPTGTWVAMVASRGRFGSVCDAVGVDVSEVVDKINGEGVVEKIVDGAIEGGSMVTLNSGVIVGCGDGVTATDPDDVEKWDVPAGDEEG